MKPATRVLALCLLVLVPLALRLVPIQHGSPRNYLPDTHEVRSALGMAKDHDLVPPVGKYSTYPNLIPYTLLPIYALQYAAGRATGAWSGAGEFGVHLSEHPEDAQIPARVWTALLGALTVYFVFRAARAAGLRQGAWASAWLLGTSLLHVQFSTQERPWAPLVCCMAAASWAATSYLARPRRAALLCCGLCAGLAFATHQAGLPVLALAALAWFLVSKDWSRSALPGRVLEGSLCVGLFALAGLVGNAYLLVHGSTPTAAVSGSESLEALAEQGSGFSFSIGGQAIHFALRWASVGRLTLALVGYDPVLLLLGLAGALLAWRLPAARASLLFGAGWALFFLTNQNDHVRYLLPLVPFLALSAGALCERCWLARAPGLRGLLVLLLAFPLVQALRFDWLLLQDDTRALAERRLALEPPALVAVDRYGPVLDLDRSSLERLQAFRSLYGRESLRLELLAAGLPAVGGLGTGAFPIEDGLLVDERHERVELRPKAREVAADPEQLLRVLGVSHVLLVERRTGAWGALRERLPLGNPEWVIDPGAQASECFLPTEMDFPLTALWQVERPGPRLELRPLLAR